MIKTDYPMTGLAQQAVERLAKTLEKVPQEVWTEQAFAEARQFEEPATFAQLLHWVRVLKAKQQSEDRPPVPDPTLQALVQLLHEIPSLEWDALLLKTAAHHKVYPLQLCQQVLHRYVSRYPVSKEQQSPTEQLRGTPPTTAELPAQDFEQRFTTPPAPHLAGPQVVVPGISAESPPNSEQQWLVAQRLYQTWMDAMPLNTTHGLSSELTGLPPRVRQAWLSVAKEALRTDVSRPACPSNPPRFGVGDRVRVRKGASDLHVRLRAGLPVGAFGACGAVIESATGSYCVLFDRPLHPNDDDREWYVPEGLLEPRIG